MNIWKWLKNLFKSKEVKVEPLPKVNQPEPVRRDEERELDAAYLEAKKYNGKKETDSKFSAFLSAFWAKVGLKSYTKRGIAGASLAWCALFFFAMNSQVGQTVIASAGAKKIGQSGYEIDWRTNGIPQSAGVWKNSSDCSSESGNHIAWADADCSAEDLLKPKATIPLYGGNQNDQVKTSIYCVKGDCPKSKDVICRVFWTKKKLPPKITKSINCTSGDAGKESTR